MTVGRRPAAAAGGAIIAEAVARGGPGDGAPASAQLGPTEGDACSAPAERGRAPREHRASRLRHGSAGRGPRPAACRRRRRPRGGGVVRGAAAGGAVRAPGPRAVAGRIGAADGRTGAAGGRVQGGVCPEDHPAEHDHGAGARPAEILEGIAAGEAGPGTCAELDALLRMIGVITLGRAASDGYAAVAARPETGVAGVGRAVAAYGP